MIKCPVCGEQVEKFDICDNCDWQNNGEHETNEDLKGPNKTTLKEAIKKYNKK